MSPVLVPTRGEVGGHEHHTGVDVLQVTTHEAARVRVGLPPLLRTRIVLTAAGDLELEGNDVEVRRLPDAGGVTRVAIMAPGTSRDHDGRVEVDVAAGRALEIVELTGSGAHDVQHARAQWLVDARLGRDAVLVWPSLPIVVADGADVVRFVHVDLAPGARVVLRETLVLARNGTASGRVRSTIRARLDDAPLLSETFVAEPAPPLLTGSHPLGAPVGAGADDHRMDTLLVLGARLDHPGALQLEREGTMLRGPAARAHDGALAGLVSPRAPVDAAAPARPGR